MHAAWRAYHAAAIVHHHDESGLRGVEGGPEALLIIGGLGERRDRVGGGAAADTALRLSALSAPDSSRQMLGDTWRLWLDSGGVDDETSTWRWELLDPVTDSDSEISPAWRCARPHRAPHMARARPPPRLGDGTRGPPSPRLLRAFSETAARSRPQPRRATRRRRAEPAPTPP